jgi:signal transduction histidine kinase
MKYFIQDKSDGEILSNKLAPCEICFGELSLSSTIKRKCSIDSVQRRLGMTRTESGVVRMCSPNENDINSSRVFRSRLEAYSSIIVPFITAKKDVAAAYNQKLKRLTHNLTSLNAHCIQEVFDLISQDTLTKNVDQQIQLIQDTMRKFPVKTAQMILRIAKNNLAMKSEFIAIRYFDETTPAPALRSHPIRKVVLNVLHAFFQDFTDKGVRVIVRDSIVMAQLDYDTFHVALYHVLDNATKYVKTNSKVEISFDTSEGHINVILDMISFAIPINEQARIGEEGFSGTIAVERGLSGHGLGVFRTKRLLSVNNAELIIRPNIDPARALKDKGIDYQNNQFILRLQESR